MLTFGQMPEILRGTTLALTEGPPTAPQRAFPDCDVHCIYELLVWEIVFLHFRCETRLQSTFDGKPSHVVSTGPLLVDQQDASLFKPVLCQLSERVSVQPCDGHDSFYRRDGQRE